MSKFEDKRTEEQKRGATGACDTVEIKNRKGEGTVRINAHEYNEQRDGKIIKHHAVEDRGEEHTDLPEKQTEHTDFSKKTALELKDHLAGKGVSFDTGAKKDELIALCEANP